MHYAWIVLPGRQWISKKVGFMPHRWHWKNYVANAIVASKAFYVHADSMLRQNSCFQSPKSWAKSLPGFWNERKCTNSSWFIWNMGKLTQRLKELKCRRGETHWRGIWSYLFYKSSLIFYYIPSWLFCLVQKCTTVPLRFPGERVLPSCITFVPPFHSWFLRSGHIIMIWEVHVAWQITHPLL